MSTHPPGWDPSHEDPTGMRDLLRSLPDPGPMPDAVRTRLAEAIALEHARREAPIHLPSPSRRAYRRTPALVAAAAVAACAGLGAIALSGMPAHVVSAFTQRTDVGSSDVTSDSASATKPVTVSMSGRTFNLGQIRHHADQAFSGTSELTGFAGESPHVGPIASTMGATDCARALGLRSGGLRIDLGTYQDSPAALVVGTNASGTRTAYLVERSCNAQAAHILEGPFAQD